jgi:hypothetical protein
MKNLIRFYNLLNNTPLKLKNCGVAGEYIEPWYWVNLK